MATISGILNNLRKANQRIEKNTADLTAEIERATTAEQNLADDYVPKAGNEAPLTESAEWQITETGALQRTATKRNITTGETSTVTQTPIPVVENQARLILPEEIEKIRDLTQWQEINRGNALNFSVDLSDIPNNGNANESAVQSYLTQKFNTAGGTTGDPTMDLITLIDENTGAKYVWYVNESAWVQSNSATGAQASNDMYDQNDNLTQLGTKGVIKGSNKKGKGFVEVDGTLSVVGFDELEQKTDNNTSALSTEKTNRENADSVLNTKIGDTDTLTTDDKTSTVSAINEIDAHADSAQTTADTAMANAATAQSTADSKYALPSGGIPKTDLDSAVQSSLSNGDAALAGLPTKQDNLSATQLANIAAVPNKADTDVMNALLAGKADIIKGTTRELLDMVGAIGNGVFVWDTTRGVLKIGTGVALYRNLEKIITEKDYISVSFAEDDWETISAISHAGKAQQYYSIGDRKTVNVGGTNYDFVIVGFNHDDLADGSGKAGITIALEGLLSTKYQMNSGDTNVGGWESSLMRTSTMATLFTQLPSDLQSVIKPVHKLASAGNKSTTITTSTDKLFLFSQVEIDNTSSATYCNEGTQYQYWKGTANGGVKDGTNANDRIKYINGTATTWWLRSPYVTYTYYFRNYYASGSVDNDGASYSYGVCFGFCV